MANYRLFDSDVFLVTAPRWGESSAFLDWVPWLAAGLVPVGLVLWLYRYEIKLVGGFTARLLLSLRLIVLTLLLFLVLWQPRVGAAVKEKGTDRVLVLVDRTGSMDATDPGRSVLEKLKLARSLKICDDIITDAQLDRWIRGASDKKPPKLVDDDEAPDSETRRHLEQERRELLQKVCERIDGQTRAQLVKRLLEKDGGKLLPDLGGRFDVQFVGFDDKVTDFAADQLDSLFASKKASNGPMSLSDFKPVLERAVEKAVDGKGAVRGVLLFSDGRENVGYVPVAEAARLGKQLAPLFPVVVGSADARTGILVEKIVAPTTILKDPDDALNENATVQAFIQVRAMPAKNLTVELLDGKKVIDTQKLRHDGKDHAEPYSVKFSTALSDEGTHRLTVRVKPPADLKDQTGLERSMVTHVIKDQADVLVIDGEARWEYHYLTVALGRDKLIKEVRGVVFDQPRIGKVREADLERNNLPALKLPEDPAALTGYDCIVLGDVPPEQLPLKDLLRLQSYVRDAGGTLVILAGKRAMPMAYLKEKPEDPTATEPITALLPIETPRVVSAPNGFPVTLADSIGAKPQFDLLLQLADRQTEGEAILAERASAKIWEELPPHYWGVVGTRKKTATSLAFYPGSAEEQEKLKKLRGKALKDFEDANALISWHEVGRGRVLYVGLDSTWRWRYKVGDRHHHRFWGQLVRCATSGKLLPGGTGKVRFGTQEPSYDAGQEIEVRLRLDKAVPVPDPKSTVVARILRIDGETTKQVSAVTLSPREGQPRTLDARLRDLPPGSYRIEMEFGDLAKTLGPDFDAAATNKQAAEFTVTASKTDGELANLAADPDMLQSLADRSPPKGESARVYSLDNAREILEKLKRHDEEKDQPPPAKPLWEWWPTLLLILGLLTIEWVTRKWAGLP